jgi:hypothetical protein
MKRSLQHVFALTLIAIPAFVGCGADPNLGQVEGVVTLDGKPLPNATVILVPGQGRPATGVTDGEGRYRVKLTSDRQGTNPGVNRVRITTERGPSETGDGKPIPPVAEAVPPQYNAASQLTVDVKKGELTVANFDLKNDRKASRDLKRR